jgi:hypothetical protein
VVVSVNEGPGPREQHNHGSGPFIGRDNYGDICYEMLDPKTKSVLAKLATDAPALAKLLTKALRDGVISPNLIEALESAVRNINEDVAYSLQLAGKNINADVAYSLQLAAQGINSDVADKLLQTAESVSEAARDLDSVLSSFSQRVEQVRYMQTESNLGYLVEPARTIDIWKAKLKIFSWGIGIGLLLGFALVYYLVK